MEEQLKEQYGSNLCKKCINYYHAMDVTSHIDSFINLLTITNSYTWALDIANEITHRQGKQRKLYGNEFSRRLARSHMEYDRVLAGELDEMFIKMINSFFTTIQLELDAPNITKDTKRYLTNDMKSCVVLLFSSGQQHVLNQIKLPQNLKKDIDKVFEILEDGSNSLFDEFLNYLRVHKFTELVTVVERIGVDKFFEHKTTKSIDIFNAYFEAHLSEFDNEEISQLLKTFEYYRQLYRNHTTDLQVKDISKYLDNPKEPFSKNIYDKHKISVINRMKRVSESFKDNEVLINKLIFRYEN